MECSLQVSTALKISTGWRLRAVFMELWLMTLLPGRLLPNAICMHCFSSVTLNGLQLITRAEKWKIQTAWAHPICMESDFNVTSFWALIKKIKIWIKASRRDAFLHWLFVAIQTSVCCLCSERRGQHWIRVEQGCFSRARLNLIITFQLEGDWSLGLTAESETLQPIGPFLIIPFGSRGNYEWERVMNGPRELQRQLKKGVLNCIFVGDGNVFETPWFKNNEGRNFII